MAAITKQAASALTNDLDRMATLFQRRASDFGISERVANDFAFRCDLLSDHISRQAGIPIEADYNPEDIGREVGGPAESEPDESYMKDEFTQQERRELRETQEKGQFDGSKDDERKPTPGKQASLRLAKAAGTCTKAASVASTVDDRGVNALAGSLSRLGAAILDVQVGLMQGRVASASATRVADAADHILPHLASVSSVTAAKLAAMADTAYKIAKAAEDEAEDDEDDEGEAAGKKAFDLTL